jgi:alpha-tubulin suppressor-like RCC1 family protein
LLGLGANTTTTNVPTEVKLADSETIQSVSIGEKHAVAVSNKGVAYTWGKCQHGIRTRADGAEPVSSPQPISFADTMLNKRKTLDDALVRHMGLGASANNASDDADDVVYAHAGRDLSVFVLESGSVLTCGQKSGRLGQGNVSMNVNSPRQMFGGLHLWRND